VGNNPVNFNDPTGHKPCDDEFGCGPYAPEPTTPPDDEDGGLPTTPYGGPCVSVVCLPTSTPAPTLPISPIIPANVPQYSAPSTTFDDLVNYWRFSFEAFDVLQIMADAENFGRPVYKHVKYTVSLSGLEYGADAGFQLYDDRNKNLIFPQRIARALIRGGESFVTDAISQGVGAAAAIGTGSPIGYFAGAYFTSGIIDNDFTDHANPYFFNNDILGVP
jgi:hypothetical protein